MVDKLRRVAPLVITHSDGEAPSAAKINAISNQLRTSTNVLEKAIGDLWNQSGDSLMVSYPLQIPNLARMVGESKFTNPCLYPVDEDFVYVDNIGAKWENQNEFYLQFKPKDLTGWTVNDTGGGAFGVGQRKTNKYEVEKSGDYWVDTETGKVICFDEISSTAEVQYTVDSSTWNIRDYTYPSVIPDPRQADYTGCRVSWDGTYYYIHLPPRCPLTLDFDGESFDGFSLPDRYPPSTDFSDNYDSTVPAGTKKLWQDPTVAALSDSFYRYSLPKEIEDNLSALAVGNALPVGLLHLWDRSSGTIIADAVFRKTANDWVFRIESATIDFSGKVSASEAEAGYNQTNYSVIACGSPLSRSIWTLSNALMNHTHGNEGDFSSTMSHSNLTGLNPPAYDHTDHTGRYPTDVPAWAPSRWANDDHVSLLSRAGSQGGSTYNRDVNDNAMLGDFLLASQTASGSNFLNITADSNKLRFGSVASGPSMFFDLSEGGLVAISETTSHHGLIGKSTSGYGLYGISDSGYGVVAQSDTSSPVEKAALRLVPQNTAPTSPLEGDIYMNSADHHLYVYNGSDWVQLDN